MAFPAPPIVLRELGGNRRIVFLAGESLPRQATAAGFGINVKGSSTYYPGSRIPTSQVWTTEQETIRFAGIFDDRRQGIPGWAVSQATLLNDMADAAYHVEIRYGPWKRICRWSHFRFTPILLSKVTYEVELVALHDGTSDAARIKSGLFSLPNIGSVLNKLALVQTALNAIDGDFVGTLVDPILGAVDSVVNSVKEIGASLNIISRTSGRTQNAQAGDLLARSQSAMTELAQAQDTARQADISQVPGTEVDQADFQLALLQALRDMQSTQEELRKLRRRLEVMAGRDDQVETYIASEDESMYRLAASRYGDAAKARDILADNALLRWSLSAGQVLCLRNAPALPKRRPVVTE